MMTLRNGLWPTLGVLALLAVGCGNDDTNPPASDTAQLRVVHASPDAPAVDIYAKGSATPLFSNIAYGTTTDFKTVPAGNVQVEIRAAGAPATGAAVYTTPALTLAKGAKYDALAAGLLASTADADKFRVLALQENFAAAGTGKIRLRIVHAGADAPAVGIDVGDDGSSEVPSLARFADTGADGVELPNTGFQVGIRAGTARVTGFTVPPLPSGTQAFVIATGLLSKVPREASGFVLYVPGIGAIKQNPRVYALHASPGAPTVDVYTGTTKLVDAISFGQLKGVQVAPGSYPLTVFPAGGSTAAAGPFPSGALAAGEQYLVIADGFLAPPAGGNAFTLLAFREQFDLSDRATKIRLRLVHGAPDVPAVDLGTVSGGTFTQIGAFTGITYTQDTGEAGLPLDPAAYTLGVRVTGTNTVLAFPAPALPAGTRAFGIAAGSLSGVGGAANSVRALVVNTSVSPWTVASISPN